MAKERENTNGMAKEPVANCDQLPEVINIQPMIRIIRERQVMLDSDLSALYGVETRRLNEQVKRNMERFPDDFMFQLSKDELDNTEWMKEYHQLEMKQHQDVTDRRIDEVFKRLDADVPPVQGIFYDGQVFDAYRFVSDLIRKAEQSVVLIDNYADDTVLTLLDKRKEGVSATIYTQRVSNQFQLDVDRHNAQYPLIEVKRFNKAHDRFLLIDDKVYHIGASIKDLGKKWFGFTFMRDITAIELINRIQL